MFVPAVRRLSLAALCVAAICGGAGNADEPYPSPSQSHFQPDDTLWRWRPLPPSLLFKPYIAGVKAPRMAAVVNSVSGSPMGDTTLDASLGGRVGLLRFGQDGPDADGWQLDVQAAAFPRLNISEDVDVDATDFRVGVPLSYRSGATAVSFGYDHISTHLGDEFIERNPDFQRVNYSRDALLVALRQDLTDELTVYGEAAYAFMQDGGSEPWAFQIGAEYYEEISTPIGGPVVAANVQMREEFDWGGRFTTVAGWQWREPETGRLLRLAGKYDAGKSPYYELFGEDETSVGFGLFYDF